MYKLTDKLKTDKTIDGYRTHDGFELRRQYAPAVGRAGQLGKSGSTVYSYSIIAPTGEHLTSTTKLRSGTTQSVIDRWRAAAELAKLTPEEIAALRRVFDYITETRTFRRLEDGTLRITARDTGLVRIYDVVDGKPLQRHELNYEAAGAPEPVDFVTRRNRGVVAEEG